MTERGEGRNKRKNEGGEKKKQQQQYLDYVFRVRKFWRSRRRRQNVIFVSYSRSWLWKSKQSIWGITVGPPKLPEHWVPTTQPRTPLKMKRKGFRRRLAKLLRMAVVDMWGMEEKGTHKTEPPCGRWKQQSQRKATMLWIPWCFKEK